MGSFYKIAFITVIFGLALAVLLLTTPINSKFEKLRVETGPKLKIEQYDIIGEEQEQTSTQPVLEKKSKTIDFAIAGFGKCGTTTLMKILNTNETYMGAENDNDLKEIHLLRHGKFDQFNKIYNHIGKKTPEGKPILKGFKSPEILMSENFMKSIELKYPETDFIVSMRHPVAHFQSMYNYKFRSKKFSGDRPDPLLLIGNCGHECSDNCIMFRNVCTRKSYFHYGLSRIMLTPMNSTKELNLLDNINWSRHPGYQGNIFLMQLEQMADRNITRRNELTNGLENFLGLDENSVLFPTRRNKTKEIYMNICDDKNQPIRDVLVEIGTKASKWIQNYLLHSPRVAVSNRDHFLELLNQWQIDPCQQ